MLRKYLKKNARAEDRAESKNPGFEEVLKTLEGEGFVCFLLDGAEMRTKDGLFEEYAQKVGFPDYFGRNWDAFNDCMTDLEIPLGVRGVAVLVRNSELVLSSGTESDKEAYISCLADISDDWAETVDIGEWWDRPAIDFRVVNLVA